MHVWHDNGAAKGLRTRVFRDVPGGVEWMFAVDYASGATRWYGYGSTPGESIEGLKAAGMFLSRLDGE